MKCQTRRGRLQYKELGRGAGGRASQWGVLGHRIHMGHRIHITTVGCVGGGRGGLAGCDRDVRDAGMDAADAGSLTRARGAQATTGISHMLR